MSGAAARTGSFKKIYEKIYINGIKYSTRIIKLKTGFIDIIESIQVIVSRTNKKD